MIKRIVRRIRSKIANKIFLSIFISILIVLLVQSFIYLFVIEDAQFVSENIRLRDNFEAFIEDIKDKNYDKEYIDLLTDYYVKDTGYFIVVFDSDMMIYNEKIIDMYLNVITVMKDDVRYKVVIDEESLSSISSESADIAVIKISQDYYALDYFIDKETPLYEDEEVFKLNDAKIIDLKLSKLRNSRSLLALYQGIDYIDAQYHKDSSTRYQFYEYKHPDINARSIYYISEYEHNNKKFYVLSATTIMGLADQLGFIANFNRYVLGVGFLLAILTAKLFSIKLSKPLVQMNQLANKMSQLDFSEKIHFESTDELGSLGMSINELSEQLEHSIQSYKDANLELQANYTLKAREEKRAKDLILHLSHELNTPLGIVSGFNEVLTDGINDKEPSYYYEAITLELDRMKQLINDMLELSVLESSNYELALDSIVIADIVSERLQHYVDVFDKHDVHLSVNLSSTRVLGNHKKIHQVVNNFISNAAKYTETGGRFEIFESDAGDSITFHFTNTSLVDETDLENLWEKFYRTKKTNARNEHGSGIGLSIAKEILSLHDSDYGVRQHDHSIEFYFALKKAVV